MRQVVSALVVSTLIFQAVANAQDSQPTTKRDARLFLSAGYGSSGLLRGLRFGAEYHFTPVERAFGLRAHLGAFWTPTQSFTAPSALYGPGTTFEGSAQVMHLDLGVTGSITPWPRSGVSPYVFGGLSILQRWQNTQGGYYRRADGSLAERRPASSGTMGQYGAVFGAGLRVRVGGRLLHFEIRKLPGVQLTFSVGTALHF